jgi:hypothetical protein
MFYVAAIVKKVLMRAMTKVMSIAAVCRTYRALTARTRSLRMQRRLL